MSTVLEKIQHNIPLNDEEIATSFIPQKLHEKWYEVIDVEDFDSKQVELKLNKILAKLTHPMKLKFHSFNSEGQALWNVWMK